MNRKEKFSKATLGFHIYFTCYSYYHIFRCSNTYKYTSASTSCYPSTKITFTSMSKAVVVRRDKEYPLEKYDELIVKLTSLTIIGSVFWIPALFIYLYKKWKNTPKEDEKKRRFYRNLLLGLSLCAVLGPHRHPKVGQLLQFKKWNIWKSWMRYVSLQVITEDLHMDQNFDIQKDRALLAFSPHGIFPFSLGFGVLTDMAKQYFGEFRPVVATATRFYPFLNTILQWLGQVDASRIEVDRALANGDKIGLAPGGISEMFEGFPKAGRHPDEECIILKNRKGFIKMALKHKLPVVPIYCFGASKMLKRLQLPLLEKMSNLIRASICIFYGMYGLPIPFRKKLLYAVGSPIRPPVDDIAVGTPEFDRTVDDMHQQFCEAMTNLFDKHKNSYGWEHKILRIV